MQLTRLVPSIAVSALIAVVAIASWPAYTVHSAGEPIRIIIELRAGTSAIEIAALRLPGVRWLRPLSTRGPVAYEAGRQRRTSADARRWRVAEVDGERADAILAQWGQQAQVLRARPVYTYQAATVPSDTRFSTQYALGTQPTGIDAENAWQKTTGARDTVIAIIDGGVDSAHEDLSEKMWRNEDEIPGNSLDDDRNGYIDDIEGWDFVASAGYSSQGLSGFSFNHGTHVAGIAAAVSNNTVGISGIDWQARILPLKVLSAGGIASEDRIISGINYAVDNGAHIINLSLAGPASQALLDSIENAYARGVVVVAAAGNNGADTGTRSVYPACADVGGVDMVLGVAATDTEGEPANFSNYGACVNIAAPGESIISTTGGNRYAALSGTSMSSPHVAGVAGLYRAVHPGATPAEVISAITSNASPFPASEPSWTTLYKGRLDAAAVVGATVVSNPSPPTNPTPSPTPSPVPSQQTNTPSSDGGGGGDSGGGGGGGEQSSVSENPAPRVAGVSTIKVNSALLARVKDTFRFVFGRLPTAIEQNYWNDRVKKGDKKTYEALLGAMRWQQANGRTYDPWLVSKNSLPATSRVAGTRITALLNGLNSFFRQIYGRGPSPHEYAYWQGRIQRGEKANDQALLGAMMWQRLNAPAKRTQ